MTARKFLLAFVPGIILGALITWLAVIIQLGVPNPTTVSLRDLVNFKKDAARKINTPKILISAGSSALEGLRADIFTRYTGIPTINLGAAGGLGMPIYCRWARELAQPGDTILLAFEYDLYDWNDFSWGHDSQSGRFVQYNVEYADYLVCYEPDYFLAMPFLQQAKTIIALPNKRVVDGLLRKVGMLLDHGESLPASDCSYLDQYGDPLSTSAGNPPHFDENALDETLAYGLQREPAGFICLREFIGWCQSHQVRVLATWPNLLYRPEYLSPIGRATASKIRNFYESMNVPVLGDYQEVLLPRDQFYDTIYHLRVDAANTRTLRLLKYWPSKPIATKEVPENLQ